MSGAIGLAAAVLVASVLLGVPRRGSARAVRTRLGEPAGDPRRPELGVATNWLAPRLDAADLGWSPHDLARAWAATPAVALVAASVAGPAAAVLVVIAAAVAPPVALRLWSDRRALRSERELPALLEAVASSLRSGASLQGALVEAAAGDSAAAADLRVVLDEVADGVALDDALARWIGRCPRPGVRLVVGGLVSARRSGGSPARSLDGLAATLRERHEVDREVRALATQARASAAVVTLAPLAFAVIGVVGDEQTAVFLLTTPAGLACLVGGLGLDGLGAWWMARVAGRPA